MDRKDHKGLQAKRCSQGNKETGVNSQRICGERKKGFIGKTCLEIQEFRAGMWGGTSQRGSGGGGIPGRPKGVNRSKKN